MGKAEVNRLYHYLALGGVEIDVPGYFLVPVESLGEFYGADIAGSDLVAKPDRPIVDIFRQGMGLPVVDAACPDEGTK